MKDEMLLKVAVAQIGPCWGCLQQNLALMLDYIVEARQQHVELLVFPEASLSGYPRAAAYKHSLRRDAPEIAALSRAADPMAVILGFVEEAPAAQFYNTCLVTRGGRTLHVHRKLNLATYGRLEEGKHFAQGRYVDGFNLVEGIWRACTLICADAWNPALVHLAALHGATLVVIPTNSAEDAVSGEFSNPAAWDLVTRFYAMIYGMPIIMANRVGEEEDLSFWGGSRIIDSFGEVIAAAGSEETLLSAELDYESVRRARIQLPTVRDSNLGLVHREISRLQQLIGVPPDARTG